MVFWCTPNWAAGQFDFVTSDDISVQMEWSGDAMFQILTDHQLSTAPVCQQRVNDDVISG